MLTFLSDNLNSSFQPIFDFVFTVHLHSMYLFLKRITMSANTVTFHYWGSVRSRNMYTGYLLAGAGVIDSVDFNGTYPYPGTPEWNEAKPLSNWVRKITKYSSYFFFCFILSFCSFHFFPSKLIFSLLLFFRTNCRF